MNYYHSDNNGRIYLIAVWQPFFQQLKKLEWAWLEEMFAPDSDEERLHQLTRALFTTRSLHSRLIVLN